MDHNTLITFVSLAETGSFSHTAEALNITQPAVSKRIALLEQTLNCQLFDRVGKSNKLTHAGELTLNRVKRILIEQKELKHDIDNLNQSITGKLVISTSHHIGLHRLPSLLSQFVEQYPQVELDMRFTDSEIAYHDVLHGDTSMAIATLPAKIDNHKIKIYPLWVDELVLVSAKNHHLAKQKRPDAKSLEQHNAILPGKGTFTRRIIDDYFKENHLKLKLAFETNYLETIRVMVASGLGWSILPKVLAEEELAILPIRSLNLTRRLGLMINQELTLPNSARVLIELLISGSDFPDQRP